MAATKTAARRNPKVKPKSKAAAPGRKRNPDPGKAKPAAPSEDSTERWKAEMRAMDSIPRPVVYPDNMPEIAEHVMDRYLGDKHKQRRALYWIADNELECEGIRAVVEAYGRFFAMHRTGMSIGDVDFRHETSDIEASQRGEFDDWQPTPDGYGEHTGRDAEDEHEIETDIVENIQDMEAVRRLGYRAVDLALKFDGKQWVGVFVASAIRDICSATAFNGHQVQCGTTMAFLYEDLRRRAGLPMHWPQPIVKKEPAGSDTPAAGKAVSV